MWRFFKDFFIYGIASVLGKIAAVLLMPVYTSILTKEEYGMMALIIACKGIIGIFSNLEIHTAVSRDYYEKDIDRKKMVSTGLYSILSLSLTVMGVMIISRHFWMGQVLGIDGRFELAFIFMLMSIPAGSLMSYFAILTRFHKKPVTFAVGSLLQLLIQIGISVYGVVYLRLGIQSVFFGVLAGELVAIAIFVFVNREDIGLSYSFPYLKRLLLFALPTLPAILANWFDNSLGQILIKKFISVEDLGVYSIALSITSVFALINVAFSNVWNPFLFENYGKPDFKKMTGRLYSTVMIAIISLTSLLSLFAREIVLLLSNPSYIEASRYIILLCFPMCMYILFPVAASGISVSRDTKYISIAYVAGSLFNILVMLLTIRRFGIIVIPVSLGLSRIVTYYTMYIISERTLRLSLPQGYIPALALLICIFFIIVSAGTGLWIRIAAALVLNGILALCLKKVISGGTPIRLR